LFAGWFAPAELANFNIQNYFVLSPLCCPISPCSAKADAS
jgi:hypothetical protein